MNLDQAALIEGNGMRDARSLPKVPEPLYLKIAEHPVRDRIQRVVELADALLVEAETLARDRAFTEETARLKPLDILGGIDFYVELHRFETHLIKMPLPEPGWYPFHPNKPLL